MAWGGLRGKGVAVTDRSNQAARQGSQRHRALESPPTGFAAPLPHLSPSLVLTTRSSPSASAITAPDSSVS